MTATATEQPTDVFAGLADLRKRAVADYQQLVFRVGSGVSVKAEQIASICAAAKKSDETFEADVDLCRRRHQALEDVRHSERLTREIGQCRKELTEAQQEHEKIEHENACRLGPVNDRMRQLRKQIENLRAEKMQTSSDAASLLVTTADKAIFEAIKAKRQEHSELAERREKLQAQLAERQQQCKDFTERWQRKRLYPHEIEPFERRQKQLEAECARLAEAIEEIPPRLDEINAEIKKLDAKKFLPEQMNWSD